MKPEFHTRLVICGNDRSTLNCLSSLATCRSPVSISQRIITCVFSDDFLWEHEIQKLQTPCEHYAAELPGNESEHVTKDSHSSFSLGHLPRKFVSSDDHGERFHQDIAEIE